MLSISPETAPSREQNGMLGLLARRSPIAIYAALAILLAPLLPTPDFLITQMNYIGIDAVAVLGIVLLTGVVGLTSFGQAAFAGVGAYTTAYLCLRFGASPWTGLLAGLLLTAIVASIIGSITLRMSGHNLPLATIAWCIALYGMMGNLEALGKYDGLTNLPRLSFFGHQLHSEREYYLVIWVVVLLVVLGLHRLLRSRVGRVLLALNIGRGGGETMPSAMGASPFRFKLLAFVLAALLACVSGWLLAHLQRTVNPSPFGITKSLEYLFMAVLGGVAHVWGAILGAGVTTLLKDSLQTWIPGFTGLQTNIVGLVFGGLLVIILKVSPRGLWELVDKSLPRKTPQAAKPGDEHLANRARPSGACLLQTEGLSKHFGGLRAVQDVSFSIATGEIVGLIGPNGAGKSTTFNLISGVVAPSQGRVVFNGVKLKPQSPQQAARGGMSRTFQHVKLIPEMSVLENVALGCFTRTDSGIVSGILGLDRKEERLALREAEKQLCRVGLQNSMFEAAGDLPLGAQRLVEIARALAADPSLLLLDEPAAGLRYGEGQALLRVLNQLREEGLSILLVEHDMDFVMNLANRIIVMESGRKLVEGTPMEIQASSVVRESYLGPQLGK